MINDFLRGDNDHNWHFLDQLVVTPDIAFLTVSDEDAEKGKGGDIYNCAIVRAAVAHFGGPQVCIATVKPTSKLKTPTLCLSNRVTRKRYELVLQILLGLVGAFNPGQYDYAKAHNIPVKGGKVLVSTVTVGPMPVDRYPPSTGKRPKGSNKRSRSPRNWSTAPLKQNKLTNDFLAMLSDDKPDDPNA